MGKTIRLYGFSSHENPKAVKIFLEQRSGEGTVCGVEFGQYRTDSRAHAKVQFTDTESAQIILTLADQRLWYNEDYLKGEWCVDLIPDPINFLCSIESITLHFGCQISMEKFSVLWKTENVTVKFGIGVRKLYFFFSYLSVEYKLDLSYENIWQSELHRPRGQTTQFLIIKLLAAPRIFEKVVPTTSYFEEVPDNYWVRDVDFTPSCCIGQSSDICLELPSKHRLPKSHDGFVYYKEVQGELALERGSTYSCNSELVPIVSPPEGIELPYKILFKINSLVQHGCVSGEALDVNFFKLFDQQRTKIEDTERALDKLFNLKDCCYNPQTWLENQFKAHSIRRQITKMPTIALDEGLVCVHRVQITPSKVYFRGPEVNVSNRVVRNWPEDIDNFLRVSIVDEDLDQIHSTDLSRCGISEGGERRTRIYERILSTLRNGIAIGDKKFEFLGFSSSQLKENSVWMFASRPGLSAEDIRKWMGDFHQIRNVARYAARLGQSFSSSRETLSVEEHEVERIPDVEVERDGNDYCFSDGIGKISADFAEIVARKCGLTRVTPSAFQIRYGGYKGVVAVDPTSSMKLSLRKSMCKYQSENRILDVLAWSKYQPCYLNRQLITLLSTLGVQDGAFEKKQKQAINQFRAISTNPLSAQDKMELHFRGEINHIIKEMLMCGYKPNEEPFMSMLLQTFQASKLQELRTRTRIHVPNGRSMMGCLDETGLLEYGQVFAQCTRRKPADDSSFIIRNFSLDRYKRKFIVRGKVVVAKNPCLHPGDVRVLMAVDVPELHHMVNCVVFPQKGNRPHPNECSGSDLDGDVYFVCWDPDLIPPQQVPPMDYSSAPSIELDHDVTMEEVQEYFTEYIVNDNMGIISNAHVVFADREPKKAHGAPCLELAKLFSVAVDFPKTGVPAEVPRSLRITEYPDFMEKPDKPTYESKQVIGRLFRQVKEVEKHYGSIKSFTRELARKSYDSDMEVDGFEDYLDEAFYYKTRYDNKLANIMHYYEIQTEAEMLTGNILKSSRHFNRRRDSESANLAVKSLMQDARRWFNEQGSESRDRADVAKAKASAWYYVTYHPSYWGRYNEGMDRDHFLSFAWCVCDKLVKIKKDNSSSRKSSPIPSLVNFFSGLLQFTGKVLRWLIGVGQ
ncbi:hypothetical protein UlMin_040668 [Ulmus minor]